MPTLTVTPVCPQLTLCPPLTACVLTPHQLAKELQIARPFVYSIFCSNCWLIFGRLRGEKKNLWQTSRGLLSSVSKPFLQVNTKW